MPSAKSTPLTLIILAAGMGSRFGGLKQVASVGPHGQRIIDYSLFDAVRTGFNRVIFVIRPELRNLFQETISNPWSSKLDVIHVYQVQDPQRSKPWGTGHALLTARDHATGPCAVINADDYYGTQALGQLAEFLQGSSGPNDHAMVTYPLTQTLSTAGSVCRGVCCSNEQSLLESVVEHTDIQYQPQGFIEGKQGHNTVTLTGEEWVSMNCWGFKPSIFAALQDQFEAFKQDNPQSEREFYLPTAIDQLLHQRALTVKVLPTTDHWMGITYPADLVEAKKIMATLTQNGVYPARF